MRRDQIVVVTALLVVAALAWGYTIWLAGGIGQNDMPDMPGMDMSGSGMQGAMSGPWTAAHFAFIFAMWAVMMVGMMTPTVTPMVLIYAGVARHAGVGSGAIGPAGWFVTGYLSAWTLFAAVAALSQLGLEAIAQLTPMMATRSRTVGGAVLLAAGVYQWLPIKDRCLYNCRSPLSFMQRFGGFQPSAAGSIRLGFLHGMYCVGCCWALMALLFVMGVMSLLWIAALMILVLLEKVLPGGRLLSRVTGCAAIVGGAWMIWAG